MHKEMVSRSCVQKCIDGGAAPQRLAMSLHGYCCQTDLCNRAAKFNNQSSSSVVALLFSTVTAAASVLYRVL